MERKEDIGRMHTAGLSIDFEYGELWRGLHRSNPLSFKRPFSFTVYKDRDKYMAEDWRGRIRFEDDDASEVINACINALPEMGGKIVIMEGVYDCYSPITIEDKYVCLEGSGVSVQYKEWGTVLRKCFNGDLLTINYTDPNASGFIVKGIHFEGQRETYTGGGLVISNAKGWLVKDTIVRSFEGTGVSISNCGWHTMMNVFVGNGGGHLIYVEDTGDFIWYDVIACKVQTTGYRPLTFTNCLGTVIGGHFESNNGDYGINIMGGSRIQLIGVWVGFCPIRAICVYKGVGCVIDGCRIYNNSTIGIFIGSYSSDIIVSNNTIEDPAGMGMVNGIYILGDNCRIIGNRIRDCSGDPIVDNGSGNIIKYNIGYPAENSGVAVFSGDGSTTTFRIEHGLANTPSKYVVSPLTPDADASRTITVDDTYITITFDTAPPSGTDNIKFGWWAEV